MKRVFLLHPLRGIGPEFGGHHLCHVAAESVHAFLGPEEQDVCHLQPCRGHGGEVGLAAGAIVHAVVQLHRLVPVVARGPGIEVVVARHLGRRFLVGNVRAMLRVETRVETLAGNVVEIVVGVEGLCRVVVSAEVPHPFGAGIAGILPRHVVRHEVDDHFQPRLVRAAHEVLKLLHAVRHVGGEVGVDVVIVLDGVGRARAAFHHGGVVGADAVGLVAGLGGVLEQAREPHVREAEVCNALQLRRREVVQLAATIFPERARGHVRGILVRIEPRENLVDEGFHGRRGLSRSRRAPSRHRCPCRFSQSCPGAFCPGRIR